MVWMLLAGAIVSEVVATSFLKLSDGLTRLVPSLVVAVGYLTSFVLLARTLRHLEVGPTYAIWSGVGTALIAVVGIVALHEQVSTTKILGILLVIGGVVLLNLSGP